MSTVRATFTLDESLAEQARRLDINVSAAARNGVATAVRAALTERDRTAYQARPEKVDEFWASVETSCDG
jgi:post-segregation antitoxin (ccd killing protein)